jgi:hypothetical protein
MTSFAVCQSMSIPTCEIISCEHLNGKWKAGREAKSWRHIPTKTQTGLSLGGAYIYEEGWSQRVRRVWRFRLWLLLGEERRGEERGLTLLSRRSDLKVDSVVRLVTLSLFLSLPLWLWSLNQCTREFLFSSSVMQTGFRFVLHVSDLFLLPRCFNNAD